MSVTANRALATAPVGAGSGLATPHLSYSLMVTVMYTLVMDVAVSDLRAHLSDWLERAREGQEVVVTDRGVPVARLLGIGATAVLERLTAEGVISRPNRATRPTASGRYRPHSRQSVAELVAEQRR